MNLQNQNNSHILYNISGVTDYFSTVYIRSQGAKRRIPRSFLRTSKQIRKVSRIKTILKNEGKNILLQFSCQNYKNNWLPKNENRPDWFFFVKLFKTCEEWVVSRLHLFEWILNRASISKFNRKSPVLFCKFYYFKLSHSVFSGHNTYKCTTSHIDFNYNLIPVHNKDRWKEERYMYFDSMKYNTRSYFYTILHSAKSYTINGYYFCMHVYCMIESEYKSNHLLWIDAMILLF